MLEESGERQNALAAFPAIQSRYSARRHYCAAPIACAASAGVGTRRRMAPRCLGLVACEASQALSHTLENTLVVETDAENHRPLERGKYVDSVRLCFCGTSLGGYYQRFLEPLDIPLKENS